MITRTATHLKPPPWHRGIDGIRRPAIFVSTESLRVAVRLVDVAIRHRRPAEVVRQSILSALQRLALVLPVGIVAPDELERVADLLAERLAQREAGR